VKGKMFSIKSFWNNPETVTSSKEVVKSKAKKRKERKQKLKNISKT
jgi:hypothetical protein